MGAVTCSLLGKREEANGYIQQLRSLYLEHKRSFPYVKWAAVWPGWLSVLPAVCQWTHPWGGRGVSDVTMSPDCTVPVLFCYREEHVEPI